MTNEMNSVVDSLKNLGEKATGLIENKKMEGLASKQAEEAKEFAEELMITKVESDINVINNVIEAIKEAGNEVKIEIIKETTSDELAEKAELIKAGANPALADVLVNEKAAAAEEFADDLIDTVIDNDIQDAKNGNV